MTGSTDATAAGSVISLPSGGGAIRGLGETFSPDLFTGTGNFSVPIAIPPGRLGLQPELTLAYSTGNGNGPFGLGWALSLPGVTRKTSHGLPRYRDTTTPAGDPPDTFVLSGVEDLVPVTAGSSGRVRYRPRTEGLFARIEHVTDSPGDCWEVRGRDGMLTRYGTPRPGDADDEWSDPAALADRRPGRRDRIFGWRITETSDVFGNLVRYSYTRDQGDDPEHRWDQPLISRIEYVDYGDRADPSFLVSVDFEYAQRPDPFSDYRAGFETRTSQLCTAIRVSTHAADGVARAVRECRFDYEQDSFNGASLLTRIDVVGVDDQASPPRFEQLPPLTFAYTTFDPSRRRFRAVTGDGLPTSGLADPTTALVDLRGGGLSDIVQLGATARYWTNRGNGRFALPRTMAEAPPHRLGDDGVRLIDADGDGRPDLLVSMVAQAGYFPMTFDDGWSDRSFQPYQQAPSIPLGDPSVRLVDLDGDGLTDVIRSGARLECFFNDPDPRRAWQRTVSTNGDGPDVDFADPRVHLADMTGDGLQDIVMLRNGNITYWPNLGHGLFGLPVRMRRAPRLAEGFDPRRLLLGDVNGDGVADLVYVDSTRVLVWGNHTGNSWSPQPVVVLGTPDVVDDDSVQLTDLHGTGMAGVLWSGIDEASGQARMRFLDFTGGRKPYLLAAVDNHVGARTTVEYASSTEFFLRDEADPATRWRTTLPFPVHVVARVDVQDLVSGGTLTTEYRYHHGYWDGVEREFRGFAMVEQYDTETINAGGDPCQLGVHFSPPTVTKSWFHPGPVAAIEAGDWTELDLRHEYWEGDEQMLSRPAEMVDFLESLPRRTRRDALRALRGRALRSELYALDGTDREELPYTVTESLSGVRAESLATSEARPAESVFFPFAVAERTTQWERGADPMNQLTFSDEPDDHGLPTRTLTVGVPRGRDPSAVLPTPGSPYLATLTTTEYAGRDDADRYLVDRVASTTSFEVVNDGRPSVFGLRDAAFEPMSPGGPVTLRLISHDRTYYDGEPFVGLPIGELGDHGAAVRVESLAFTDRFLDELFDELDPHSVGRRPAYLDPSGSTASGQEYPADFAELTPELAGYVHYVDGEVPGSPGGFYVSSIRRRLDVHDPTRIGRGMSVAALDPLGSVSEIAFDEHDFLPVESIDAAGLAVHAENDLRALQARQVTDINGNTAAVSFSPAGFVTATFVRGKNGEGDSVLPSRRMEYDLFAFEQRSEPVWVQSVSRIHHDSETEVPTAERDEVIVSVDHSDGFGRLLQTRAQAEDVLFGDTAFGGGVISGDQNEPVTATSGRARQPADPDNVVVSGWQTYDNKGRVVEKYEPFFAGGFAFAAPVDAELGQKATTLYDPRGHPVRTVNPDGSEQLTIIGVPTDLGDPDVYAPSPWEAFTYDANDNAGRTHADGTEHYRSHWDTPSSTTVDALGRTVASTVRNGADRDDWFTTEFAVDIRGNVMTVTDPMGRVAFRYRHDLLGRQWRVDSIDGGRVDSLLDALGRPIERHDGKGAITLTTFDPLQRPTRVWARDDATGPITLRQRIEYGDGGRPDQPASERQQARAHNLLGHVGAHFDEAGLVTIADVDFKGNGVDASRRMIADAPILAVYEHAAANGWQVTPFHVDWQPAPGQSHDERAAELLDGDVYRTTTSYDALDRVVRQVLPLDVEGRRRELHPRYNRAGELEQVRLDDDVYVEHIAYDAKGQRSLIAFGNGVMCRYAYDPRTFSLTRLRSEHYTKPDEVTFRPDGPALQDLGYDYDLAGNVVAIRDRTPGSGIPSNPTAFATLGGRAGRMLVSGDALDRQFAYDPLYRLISADGRETDAPDTPPWDDRPRSTDVTRARAYTEVYTYDRVGNLLRLDHRNGPGGFTREFALEPGSNRLRSVRVGSDEFACTFDASGNMRSETGSRHFDWSHGDQLIAFGTQTPGAEPSLHAQYLYDAEGQRVKKLVRRQGGQVDVTHYLGDAFEHHRWGSPGSAGANNHVHVMDDQRRIALVRIGAAHPDDRGRAVQFHHGDHIGSSNVVVDDVGSLTNREEYTPYGETSFGSFSRKRYRFTGAERDEESGLCCMGARYFAPWTARFTSVDPLDFKYPSWSPFCYALANPLRFVDPTGMGPEEDLTANIDATQDLARRGQEAAARVVAAELDNAVKTLEAEAAPPGKEGKPARDAAKAATKVFNDARRTATELAEELNGARQWLSGRGQDLVHEIGAGPTRTPHRGDLPDPNLARLTEASRRVQNAQNTLATTLRREIVNVRPWTEQSAQPRPPSSGGRPPSGGDSGGGNGGNRSFWSRAWQGVKNLFGKKMMIGALKWGGPTVTIVQLSHAQSAKEVVDIAGRGAMAFMGAKIGVAVCGGPAAPWSVACGLIGGVLGAYGPEIANFAVAAGKSIASAAARIGRTIWRPIDLQALRAQLRTP